ncbi:hypothetical protein PL2TA16_03163 [Pseudoalteromonas luteoviolacea 2ta16]|uniref:Uncharacterized protein n=1 Tax=Pseudoalteromonas luteoviolacea (strain 2ta16) TaxID=1353533 RepID=V4JEX7_PSEL2|nr:hypothetical protein PL2TA16_03163 [Pseudoalteromonas luteoviolacea 2ta16]
MYKSLIPTAHAITLPTLTAVNIQISQYQKKPATDYEAPNSNKPAV